MWHAEYFEKQVLNKLDAIGKKLNLIITEGADIMSVETDLQDDLDKIQAGVNALLGAAKANAAEIADLRAQLAAGTPVTQSQLDALDAEAKAIVASLTPLAAA